MIKAGYAGGCRVLVSWQQGLVGGTAVRFKVDGGVDSGAQNSRVPCASAAHLQAVCGRCGGRRRWASSARGDGGIRGGICGDAAFTAALLLLCCYSTAIYQLHDNCNATSSEGVLKFLRFRPVASSTFARCMFRRPPRGRRKHPSAAFLIPGAPNTILPLNCRLGCLWKRVVEPREQVLQRRGETSP